MKSEREVVDDGREKSWRRRRASVVLPEEEGPERPMSRVVGFGLLESGILVTLVRAAPSTDSVFMQ